MLQLYLLNPKNGKGPSKKFIPNNFQTAKKLKYRFNTIEPYYSFLSVLYVGYLYTMLYKVRGGCTALSTRFMEWAAANYQKLSPRPDGFAELRNALGKMYSTEPDLKPEEIKTIKVPTVIACGQYEQFIKLEHFKELANLIPNGKLVILQNVSHGGPLQDPANFHKAVVNLLDVH
jgi:pimeloyl-ACP methyl ester carboxylesterase